MKRPHYIIVALVLLLVAAYFFFSNPGSTLKGEFSEFAIEDTSSINKIFISDSQGQNALLERQSDNSWIINGKFKVRRDAIDLLLKTFNRIDVREPVSKSNFNTVIKGLAANSTKVEIYTGDDEPHKVYYVGHATKTHYGTNMLLEVDGNKSSVPFVTHVPGFFGYLSTRFFTEEDLWRHRAIFEFEIDQIASVELSFLEKPLKSFKLSRLENNAFVLEDKNNMEKIVELNSLAIDEYMTKLSKLHYEYIDRESGDSVIDSVKNSLPLHTLIITDNSGNRKELNTYYKPITDGTLNPLTNEPYEYNLDRLYGWIKEGEFVVIQWPSLEQVLAYKEDFLLTENIEN